MRILQITPDYPPTFNGGIGVYTEAIVSELRRLGVQIDILTIGSPELNDGVERSPVLGPAIDEHLWLWTHPPTALQYNLSLLAGYVRRWPKAHFEAIHAQHVYVSWAAYTIGLMANIPVVLTEHGVPFKGGPVPNNDYWNDVRAWIYSNVSRLVVLSQEVREQASHLCPSIADRCVVIGGSGVHILDIPPSSSAGKAPEGSTKEPRDEIIVLQVGRIVVQKGLDVAVEALSLLDDLPVRLIFVGSGGFDGQTREIAAARGVADRVEFLGQLKGVELRKAFEQADIVIAPSRFESFGLTVAEALALGKVVIGANVGGIRDQIRDGENGLLFESGNADDLAKKIRWAIAHPDQAVRLRKAAETLAAKYAWRDVAKRIAEQYNLAIKSMNA